MYLYMCTCNTHLEEAEGLILIWSSKDGFGITWCHVFVSIPFFVFVQIKRPWPMLLPFSGLDVPSSGLLLIAQCLERSATFFLKVKGYSHPHYVLRIKVHVPLFRPVVSVVHNVFTPDIELFCDIGYLIYSFIIRFVVLHSTLWNQVLWSADGSEISTLYRTQRYFGMTKSHRENGDTGRGPVNNQPLIYSFFVGGYFWHSVSV